MDAFKTSRSLFHSDGEVMHNGHIKTQSGALLTASAVVDALKNRNEEKCKQEEQRLARLQELEQMRKQRR